MKARTTIILAVVAAILVVIAVVSNRSEKARETMASGPIFADLVEDAVTSIRMTTEKDTVRLAKSDEGWLVATEGNYRADQRAMDQIMEKLPSLDRRYLRSSNPEMQATFEVDDSSGTEIEIFAGNRSVAHMRMGKNGPDFRSQYIRPVGTNQVYLVPDRLSTAFNAGRPTWRDKTIFDFDQEKVAQLRVHSSEEESYVLAKNDQGVFVMTEPDSVGVKPNLVTSMTRGLSNLRCDAFPDSVPALPDAGLAPPLRQIEVSLDDGASYVLNVGEETDAARHYVKKDGDDTVFLLSAGRISSLIRALDEIKEEPPEEPESGEAP